MIKLIVQAVVAILLLVSIAGYWISSKSALSIENVENRYVIVCRFDEKRHSTSDETVIFLVRSAAWMFGVQHRFAGPASSYSGETTIDSNAEIQFVDETFKPK